MAFELERGKGNGLTMKRRNFFGAALLSAGTSSALLAGSTGNARPAPLGRKVVTVGSIAAMRREESLRIGDRCVCTQGTYEILAANTFPPNGRTVVDLAGGAGQAVLAAADPLADMGEMLGDTRPGAWFSETDVVGTRAENFSFEVARADAPSGHVANAGGAQFRIIDRPEIAFDAFGGGVDRTGAENARALRRSMDALGTRGGKILFAGGTYRFAPATYPVTGANVWLIGAGFHATQFAPASHDGKNREWMMIFGEDDTPSYLGFSGIDVTAPDAPTRAKFNGILLRSTNQLIVRDCYGHFVDGTAWQIERAHNSKIDIRTFKCGSREEGLNSVLVTGSLGDFGRDRDAAFNDAVIVGMTEQDYLGWKIENGLVIRPESSIKVHGGPEATRSLHLHCISNGAMSVYPTLGFDSDAFIMISDAGGAETQSMRVQAAPAQTRFNLNIISNHNIRYFGKETGALIAIDCQVPGSRVILSGDLLKNIPGEGEYRYVRLLAPGHAAAEVDLSDLKFQDEDASKWVEDNRTQSSKTISRRATGLFLPAVIGFAGSGAARKVIGQTDHIVANGGPGGGAAPRMSLIGLTEANRPGGTLLYSAMQPLTASIETAAGACTIIASQPLNIPLHGGNSAGAVLRRLTFGAAGIPDAHDPSNFWQLRLYVVDVATDLVLRRDAASASEGDGLPSKVLGGWAPDSQGFDFHQGLGRLIVTNEQTFSVRLEPIGSPAELKDITATVYLEMRH
jgi:hypothetical protein